MKSSAVPDVDDVPPVVVTVTFTATPAAGSPVVVTATSGLDGTASSAHALDAGKRTQPTAEAGWATVERALQRRLL